MLHGGEPLLAGHTGCRRSSPGCSQALDRQSAGWTCGSTRTGSSSAANSVSCSPSTVKVGISIDGDQAANDRHRLYADGHSSYDKVIRGHRTAGAGRFRNLYAGLLCTIDVANDPLVVYESLMALRPPRIDFLLPHATWDHPPAPPRGSTSTRTG